MENINFIRDKAATSETILNVAVQHLNSVSDCIGTAVDAVNATDSVTSSNLNATTDDPQYWEANRASTALDAARHSVELCIVQLTRLQSILGKANKMPDSGRVECNEVEPIIGDIVSFV